MTLILLAVVAALAVTLLYRGRPYWAWVGPGAIGLPWWAGANSPDQLGAAFAVVATTFVVLALVLGVPSVRAVARQPICDARHAFGTAAHRRPLFHLNCLGGHILEM